MRRMPFLFFLTVALVMAQKQSEIERSDFDEEIGLDEEEMEPLVTEEEEEDIEENKAKETDHKTTASDKVSFQVRKE